MEQAEALLGVTLVSNLKELRKRVLMRITTSIIATILLVFALLGSAGWTVSGQRSKMTQVTWEYKVIPTDSATEGEKTLNELGAHGWELVSVQAVPIGTTNNTIGAYYLKRAK